MSAPDRLDWGDPIAVSRWLGALRVTLGDHLAITDDMLRPPRKRELGPVLHRERAHETAAQLHQLLDAATPPDDEPGDPTGNGGAGAAH